MKLKVLYFFVLIATTQGFNILGSGGLINKAADTIGISNLVNAGANARGKVGNSEVGLDAEVAVGATAIGAHGDAEADVLSQKARAFVDVLDGQKVERQNHEVLFDEANRPYILQKEYIGARYFLVKKYLDSQQPYVRSNDYIQGYDQPDISRRNSGSYQYKYYHESGQYDHQSRNDDLPRSEAQRSRVRSVNPNKVNNLSFESGDNPGFSIATSAEKTTQLRANNPRRFNVVGGFTSESNGGVDIEESEIMVKNPGDSSGNGVTAHLPEKNKALPNIDVRYQSLN